MRPKVRYKFCPSIKLQKKILLAHFMILLLLNFLGFLSLTSEAAQTEPNQFSLSKGAFAPNAGGQDAYSARFYTGNYDSQIFVNRSLSVGGAPLLGATTGKRFFGCNDCFWKPFIGLGAGLSNAGILVELDWAITFPILPIWLPMSPPKYVPQLRIDFATHLIFGQIRPSVWSYPLWLGIALPF